MLEVVDIGTSNNCEAGIQPDESDSDSSFDPQLLFTKYEIENAVMREAVCNDGSPAVFYYRHSQSDSKDWKIHLQGGGDCSTEADCALRGAVTAETVAGNAQLELDQTFMSFVSSLEYPDNLNLEGIFSLDLEQNPVFANFNHVYIPYCSSDSHYGDRAAEDESFGYHFKGAKIIQAVIEDLLNNSILGENNLQNSELVLVSGTSAGGRGVQQNLDRIADQIPLARVFGVTDSSYFTRYFLTDEERIGLARRQSELWNAQYDNSCASFIGEQDKHLCDRVELMFDYIQTPLFVYMDQLDEVALGNNTDQSEEFSVHIRNELQSLCGVFSGKFGTHGALKSDEEFFASTISGYSFHDVLVNWLYGDETSIKTVISEGPVVACSL